MKKPKWPQHKMGKYCGYDEFEDGSIKIASGYADRFKEVGLSRMAADELLKVLTKQCYEIQRSLVEMNVGIWDDVDEDYGLDREKYDYHFHHESRVITRKEKAEEPLGEE